MLPEQVVIVGAILSFTGGLSYLIDTLKGKAMPNRVSWFMWALAPFIAFAAEIRQGVGIHALLTFMVGFNPFLIFIASFVNKKAVWRINRLDISCGIFSVVGLVIWFLTDDPTVAIIFSILADGIAGIPTIIKSYTAPETENYVVFLMGVVASGLTLLTIDDWTFAHYGFPLYIFLICMLLFILIRFKVGVKK